MFRHRGVIFRTWLLQRCISQHSTVIDVHGSLHRKRISKCNPQDAPLHKLFISVKCSTCFRPFFRPSSGAQTVYTASGILSKLYCYLPLSWKSSISSTTVAGSSKGMIKVPDSVYTVWAPDDGRRNDLKHVEHFTEINNLCNVASFWLHLEINSTVSSALPGLQSFVRMTSWGWHPLPKH